MNGQKKFNLLSVGGVLLDFLLRVPEIISVFGCLGEKERRGTTRGTTETWNQSEDTREKWRDFGHSVWKEDKVRKTKVKK